MNTKIEVQRAVKEINAAIADYVEEKIDDKKLQEILQPYNNGDMEEKFIRNGIFVIPIIFHYIFDRCDVIFDKEEGKEKGLRDLKKIASEYSEEFKEGVEPQYSKIEFSYSWKSLEYTVEVKNG